MRQDGETAARTVPPFEGPPRPLRLDPALGSAFLVRTIPSSDRGFAEAVGIVARRRPVTSAADLEARLRRLYPRVVVRDRLLTGESRRTLYVYRDGHWVASSENGWWTAAGVASLVVDPGGFLADANDAALAVLGIGRDQLAHRHTTDFLVPGSLSEDEARELLALPIESNAVIRILDGERRVREIEFHSLPTSDGRRIFLRPVPSSVAPEPPVPGPAIRFVCEPPEDDAFRELARELLSWMPAPTPAGLQMRLRRIYPRATVERLDDAEWRLRRDAEHDDVPPDGWWRDPRLPRVVWDDDGLIVDANDAARDYLGVASLVGSNWRQIAAGGGRESEQFRQVIHELGVAASTWHLVGADGREREYDHRTEIHGELFVTVMRPR